MWVQANVLAPKVAGLGADSVSFDDFNWAVAIVLSRSFYVDNGQWRAKMLMGLCHAMLLRLLYQ